MEQKRNNKNNLFDVDSDMKTVTKVMFTHMGALRGIKLVGERAIAAIFKSLNKLGCGTIPGKKLVKAINLDFLLIEKKSMALNTMNLIKETGDGKIKG